MNYHECVKMAGDEECVTLTEAALCKFAQHYWNASLRTGTWLVQCHVAKQSFACLLGSSAPVHQDLSPRVIETLLHGVRWHVQLIVSITLLTVERSAYC